MARQSPDIRKAQLFAAAIEEARAVGYHKMTRKAIAGRLGLSRPLVTWYLGSIQNLRDEVMAAAVLSRDLVILGQGIANNDPIALACDMQLRQEALSLLVKQ